MTVLSAALGPSAYWYLARGTGAVALVLLTASVVLGILGPLRVTGYRWPRFAVDTLHRDVSLLVIALLVIHILTSVLDGFAPIAVTDGVIPFASPYRTLWLGLGTLAFDLMLALVLTSLVRRRLGHARWRLVHWLAYVSWPVAVLHGLGTGTDTKIWWMLLLTAACTAAVAIAVCVRIARAEGVPAGLRTPGVALSLAAVLALAIFTIQGPLAHHWAERAGTPASLLFHASTVRVSSTRPVTSGTTSASAGRNPGAFSATLNGTISQFTTSGGELVDLDMHLSGGQHGRLRVRLAGAPAAGGGLSMAGSQVDLLTPGMSAAMAGQVSSLEGNDFVARVTNAAGSLTLHARLNINQQTGVVTGLLAATK